MATHPAIEADAARDLQGTRTTAGKDLFAALSWITRIITWHEGEQRRLEVIRRRNAVLNARWERETRERVDYEEALERARKVGKEL